MSLRHDMACPPTADGRDSLQIWRVTVNILHTRLQKADKGWYSSLGVGRRVNNSSV